MNWDSEKREPALERAVRRYWQQSQLPLASLLFVLPLLVIYEAGILWLGPDAVRNGAEYWLRGLLKMTGFGQYFLLPVLTIGVLLGWHHTLQKPWRVRPMHLLVMLGESLLLAALLLLLFRFQHAVFNAVVSLAAVESGPAWRTQTARLIGYCGAGLYEELLFRLLLLPAVIGVCRWAGMKRLDALLLAVVATSLLFSAVHYDFLVPRGDDFRLDTFLFRFFAGVFFAVLFLCRGFGIAAGAHALYDICIVIG